MKVLSHKQSDGILYLYELNDNFYEISSTLYEITSNLYEISSILYEITHNLYIYQQMEVVKHPGNRSSTIST